MVICYKKKYLKYGFGMPMPPFCLSQLHNLELLQVLKDPFCFSNTSIFEVIKSAEC